MKNFGKLIKKKGALFQCIFLTLLFQILITYFTVNISNKLDINKYYKKNPILYFGLLFIIVFIIFIMMSYTESFMIKQLLFILYSITIGLFLSSIVFSDIEDKDIIKNSLISTIINFIIIFIFGIIVSYYNIDLSWLAIVSFVFLLSISTIIVMNSLSNEKKDDRYSSKISIAIIILFSLFVLYDTNKILLKYDNNKVNCINGALDYYVNFLNLFTSYSRINQ